MIDKLFIEEEFWNWHDEFKARGGYILRCLEIRSKQGINYRVVFVN